MKVRYSKLNQQSFKAVGCSYSLLFGLIAGCLVSILNFNSQQKVFKSGKLINAGTVFSDFGVNPLYDAVKIVCIVPIESKYLKSEGIELATTWGRRCNKIVFTSYVTNDFKQSDELLNVVNMKHNYTISQNFGKIKESLEYTFNHFYNDGDWFLIVKLNTYVIMENLRHLLFQYNSSWPLVFGQRYLNEGYMASGSVLLSKEALYRLAVQSIPDNKKCDMRWDGHSGLGLQRCLDSVNVLPVDSRDNLFRGRFFEEPVEISLFPIVNQTRRDKYYWHVLKQGLGSCCADSAISFHSLPPGKLYLYEYLLYMVRTIGRSKKPMLINMNKVELKNIERIALEKSQGKEILHFT